jgi:hypothetical protein
VLADEGLILANCEKTPYFAQVLRRLTHGQRAAYSELVVGSSLISRGYNPRFESQDGEPDVTCTADEVEIAFEVYAPVTSQASRDRLAAVRELQKTLTEAIPGSRLEVDLLADFTPKDLPFAVEVARQARSFSWTPVNNWARIRRIDQGQPLPPTFDGQGLQVRVGGDTEVKGVGTSVLVRWEQLDIRAELSLQAKRAQVSSDVANIVVIHVSAVGGINEWPEVIAELPGTDYEKIGAIAFFEQGVLGPPERIRRRWRIVENPHADHRVPPGILLALESLDESKYWGVPMLSRLRMI